MSAAKIEDEHLGDQHDLHVEPQRAQQVRQAVPAGAEVEEAVAHARPAACCCRPRARRPGDHDRCAGERDERRAAGARRGGRHRARVAAPTAASSVAVTRRYFSTGACAARRPATCAAARQRAVGAQRVDGLRDARGQRAALVEHETELLGLAGHRQLADDRAVGHLRGGDVERRWAGRRPDRRPGRSSAPARRGRWSGTRPACVPGLMTSLIASRLVVPCCAASLAPLRPATVVTFAYLLFFSATTACATS